MQLKEYSQLLKQDFDKSLYFAYGNEPLLISRLLKTIQKKVIGENPDDFSLVSFYGSSTKASSVIGEAEQLPFLSPKRLIFVKEVDRFATDDLNLLVDYVASPAPTSVVVFVAQSVDKRTKFYKAISKACDVMELNTPPEADLKNWVDRRVRHEGKMILPDALELLMANSASTLTFLALEVEKLLLLAKDAPQITLDDVVQITSQSKIKSVFDMWEAIATRRKDLAFYILRGLQQERISIQELIGLFRWQLSRLFQGQELVKSGRANKKEVASALKIPFFVADKFISQLRQFPHKRIRQAYDFILSADEELKVGSRQEKEILDLLLYRLMAS